MLNIFENRNLQIFWNYWVVKIEEKVDSSNNKPFLEDYYHVK